MAAWGEGRRTMRERGDQVEHYVKEGHSREATRVAQPQQGKRVEKA